jgi:hypothetical protein
LQRINKSHSAMTVRVLPAPVAMTTKAFLWRSRSIAKTGEGLLADPARTSDPGLLCSARSIRLEMDKKTEVDSAAGPR